MWALDLKAILLEYPRAIRVIRLHQTGDVITGARRKRMLQRRSTAWTRHTSADPRFGLSPIPLETQVIDAMIAMKQVFNGSR
jgi:hypothetical protein